MRGKWLNLAYIYIYLSHTFETCSFYEMLNGFINTFEHVLSNKSVTILLKCFEQILLKINYTSLIIIVDKTNIHEI
jgi:hypothetical protein